MNEIFSQPPQTTASPAAQTLIAFIRPAEKAAVQLNCMQKKMFLLLFFSLFFKQCNVKRLFTLVKPFLCLSVTFVQTLTGLVVAQYLC